MLHPIRSAAKLPLGTLCSHNCGDAFSRLTALIVLVFLGFIDVIGLRIVGAAHETSYTANLGLLQRDLDC